MKLKTLLFAIAIDKEAGESRSSCRRPTLLNVSVYAAMTGNLSWISSIGLHETVPIDYAVGRTIFFVDQ